MHVAKSITIVLLIYSIEIEASLYFVGIYTAKETYICVTCEKDKLVGCTIFIKTIGTTGI